MVSTSLESQPWPSAGLKGQKLECILKYFLCPASNESTNLWFEGVTQAVWCLLCKHEALSSNPVPPKKSTDK
jgi:hypothetical protein